MCNCIRWILLIERLQNILELLINHVQEDGNALNIKSLIVNVNYVKWWGFLGVIKGLRCNYNIIDINLWKFKWVVFKKFYSTWHEFNSKKMDKIKKIDTDLLLYFFLNNIINIPQWINHYFYWDIIKISSLNYSHFQEEFEFLVLELTITSKFSSALEDLLAIKWVGIQFRLTRTSTQIKPSLNFYWILCSIRINN